jgi:hypothetical protein
LTLVFAIFDELRTETSMMASLQKLKEDVIAERQGEEWQFIDGLITIRDKVYVAVDSPSLPTILKQRTTWGMG